MMNSINIAIALSPLVLAQIASVKGEHSVAVWWILGLAGAAVMFNQISEAWTRMTRRFQDRTPDGAQIQSVEECRRVHQGVTKAFEDLDRDIEQVNVRTEERVGKIHSRLDGIVALLHELKGAISNHLEQDRRAP